MSCKQCGSSFSIASGGDADIKRHLDTDKHQKANLAASSSQPITSLFASTFDSIKAAREGVWAYHTLNENQSFKSSDCASKIFKKCFQMPKFTCSRKKCAAIITSVIAPFVKKTTEKELEQCHFVSVYTDASNHGSSKLFPVLARYFVPTAGVRVKVLETSSESGENSEKISSLIVSTGTKYGITKKMVGFCVDNAKVNFGGSTRGGENNVFYRLKLLLPHLIAFGCVAHIEHNGLKHACDAVPFDVKCVVVKIYSHFYIYTVRTEALKTFCAEADVEYMKLLRYAKTRFLALAPAVKRILSLFNALKMYFIALPEGEKMLKQFFNDPSSKFWLAFVQEQVKNELEHSIFLFGFKCSIFFLRRNFLLTL